MVNIFFNDAFDYLMGNESRVITNDPHDSGGLTNWGITKRAYMNFIGQTVSDDYFCELSLDNKKWFYRKSYWEKLGCDQMEHESVATAIFDTSVLYGQSTTALLAQKTADICGAAMRIDGILGPQSVIMINAIEPNLFIDAFRANVLARIDSVCLKNPTDEIFRHGWTNRANRLLTLKEKIS